MRHTLTTSCFHGLQRLSACLYFPPADLSLCQRYSRDGAFRKRIKLLIPLLINYRYPAALVTRAKIAVYSSMPANSLISYAFARSMQPNAAHVAPNLCSWLEGSTADHKKCDVTNRSAGEHLEQHHQCDFLLNCEQLRAAHPPTSHASLNVRVWERSGCHQLDTALCSSSNSIVEPSVFTARTTREATPLLHLRTVHRCRAQSMNGAPSRVGSLLVDRHRRSRHNQHDR